MRDIVVLLVFALWAVYALPRPFAGLLLYNWISIMNPHRLGWGRAASLPLAMVAAAITFVGLFRSPDQARFPRDRNMTLMIAIWIWITVTTMFSFYPQDAWVIWNDVSKTFAMAIVAACLLTDQRRVLIFVLSIVGFVGFYGIKGAIFGAATGGRFKVWGPDGSALADNNAVGLALVMIVPLCFFLAPTARKRWHSLALMWTGLASIVSAALTYSRGALIGLIVIAAGSLVYSKRKFLLAAALTLLVVGALAVVPAGWMDRMSSIEDYEEDRSAGMRLNSWHMSFNLAMHHPLGGGFDCFRMEQYYKYAPDPELGRTKSGVGSTAHSAYFEVMAMHGFPGFALYMTSLISMLFSLRRIARGAGDRPEHAWIRSYARAFIVSTLGFMSCGAFQSKAFFDLFWMIYAAAIAFCVVAREELEVESPAVEPARSFSPLLEPTAKGTT